MGKEKRQKEEKPGKRKKKSHRLYALVVLLLGIAIIALGVLLLFYVRQHSIDHAKGRNKAELHWKRKLKPKIGRGMEKICQNKKCPARH